MSLSELLVRAGGREPRNRRSRVVLGIGILLTTAIGFGSALAAGLNGAAPQQTDAAWITEEAGVVTATAGTVAAPTTTCVGQNSAPNLLHLTPPAAGLEVTGYRVTLTLQDGDDADEEPDPVPQAWQSGEASAGVPLLAANTSTDLPPSTSTVAWGISAGYNYTWSGVATVEALGPGGWTSETVTHDWSIGFNLLGMGFGACT